MTNARSQDVHQHLVETDAVIDDSSPNLPRFVPSVVLDRLRSIEDIAAERNAAVRGYSEEYRATWNDLAVARERVRDLERDPKHNSDAIAAQQQKVARLEKDLARVREQLDKIDPASRQAGQLSGSLHAYVRAHAAGGIILHTGPAPQLQNGERPLEGLERASRRTRTLQADRREVMAAPFPSALAKKLAYEQLEARAEAAKPDVAALLDRCEPIRFPMDRRTIEQHGGSQDLYAVDPVGLLMWAVPDLMRVAIDREIDANAEDEIALTATERIERLATIDADLLWSQREEAAFAELAGQLPRPDIDPRAALGLADTMPAPARG